MEEYTPDFGKLLVNNKYELSKMKQLVYTKNVKILDKRNIKIR